MCASVWVRSNMRSSISFTTCGPCTLSCLCMWFPCLVESWTRKLSVSRCSSFGDSFFTCPEFEPRLTSGIPVKKHRICFHHLIELIPTATHWSTRGCCATPKQLPSAMMFSKCCILRAGGEGWWCGHLSPGQIFPTSLFTASLDSFNSCAVRTGLINNSGMINTAWPFSQCPMTEHGSSSYGLHKKMTCPLLEKLVCLKRLCFFYRITHLHRYS